MGKENGACTREGIRGLIYKIYRQLANALVQAASSIDRRGAAEKSLRRL